MRILFTLFVLASSLVQTIAREDSSKIQKVQLGYTFYGDDLFNEFFGDFEVRDEGSFRRSSGCTLRLEARNHAFSIGMVYQESERLGLSVYGTRFFESDKILSTRIGWDTYKRWKYLRPFFGISMQADYADRSILHGNLNKILDGKASVIRTTIGYNLGLMLEMGRFTIKAGGTAQIGLVRIRYLGESTYNENEHLAYASPLCHMTLLVDLMNIRKGFKPY